MGMRTVVTAVIFNEFPSPIGVDCGHVYVDRNPGEARLSSLVFTFDKAFNALVI
jgi:hypothetical protein